VRSLTLPASSARGQQRGTICETERRGSVRRNPKDSVLGKLRRRKILRSQDIEQDFGPR
jgi:hypothetical protein